MKGKSKINSCFECSVMDLGMTTAAAWLQSIYQPTMICLYADYYFFSLSVIRCNSCL